tara:strand:- start:68 stop:295 length:228 start_codon:yes stop_codon:yes gene_type:complete
MIKDSSKLIKGQSLKVELTEVKERLPKKVLEDIRKNPVVELVGYKMVDGNQFGLAVKLQNGEVSWFFENELTETM